MRNRVLAVALALCLGAGTASSQPVRGAAFPPPAPDSLVVGPLAIMCRPGEDGSIVTCILNLAAVLVGAHTLTARAPVYDFDVVAGNATAKGRLSVMFVPADQLSTLQADLQVGVTGQQPQAYRGTFLYWRISSGSPQPPAPVPPGPAAVTAPASRPLAWRSRAPRSAPGTPPAPRTPAPQHPASTSRAASNAGRVPR